MRVFPISNWTEMDVWQYIQQEGLEVPEIYFAHERDVFKRNGMWLSTGPFLHPRDNEPVTKMTVRYRTVGDMTCTGAVESNARNARRDRHRDGRGADHRARRDARRRRIQRDSDGRSQARGVLLKMVTTMRDPGQMDLLRFSTAGSVDDGKSTLIGRLLYDSKGIFEDQLAAIEQTSRRRGNTTGRSGAAD